MPKSLNDKLIEAAKKDDIELVESILNQGADIDATDQDGNTALHWAVLKRNTELVQFLIENQGNKAIIEKENYDDHKPFDLLFLDPKGDINYSYFSKEEEAEAIAAIFIENGINVNRLSTSNDSPLLNCLICDENYDLAKLVIEHGAELDVIEYDMGGVTALHRIAMSGEGGKEIVELLLAKNIDVNVNVNVQDEEGNTALHAAVKNDFIEMVRLLLNTSTCQTSIKNDAEQTPLDIAKENDSHEIIELFQENEQRKKTAKAAYRLLLASRTMLLAKQDPSNLNFTQLPPDMRKKILSHIEDDTLDESQIDEILKYADDRTTLGKKYSNVQFLEVTHCNQSRFFKNSNRVKNGLHEEILPHQSATPDNNNPRHILPIL